MNEYASFPVPVFLYAWHDNPISKSKNENEVKISVNNEGVFLQFHWLEQQSATGDVERKTLHLSST